MCAQWDKKQSRYIVHSSWNFAEIFCELRGILRGKLRGLRGELRGKFRENSPKYCVIPKKFRTNFKVLHGQNPKNLPVSANSIQGTKKKKVYIYRYMKYICIENSSLFII